MNHTDRIYQITQKTAKALRVVENGGDPWAYYREISEICRGTTTPKIVKYFMGVFLMLLFASLIVFSCLALYALIHGRFLLLAISALLDCLIFPAIPFAINALE